MSRFEIKDDDYKMDFLRDRKGNQYISLDGLIGWFKIEAERLKTDKNDAELIHTIIKSLIRYKNRTNKKA